MFGVDAKDTIAEARHITSRTRTTARMDDDGEEKRLGFSNPLDIDQEEDAQ